MLYIQNEKWLTSYVLILHLISHLSGECSFRKAISSLVGYVSQTFIRGFFKQKIDKITDQNIQIFGRSKDSSTIWSYGGVFGKAVSLLLSYTLLGRHYLELDISFVQNVKSVRKQFLLVLDSKLLSFRFSYFIFSPRKQLPFTYWSFLWKLTSVVFFPT